MSVEPVSLRLPPSAGRSLLEKAAESPRHPAGDGPSGCQASGRSSPSPCTAKLRCPHCWHLSPHRDGWATRLGSDLGQPVEGQGGPVCFSPCPTSPSPPFSREKDERVPLSLRARGPCSLRLECPNSSACLRSCLCLCSVPQGHALLPAPGPSHMLFPLSETLSLPPTGLVLPIFWRSRNATCLETPSLMSRGGHFLTHAIPSWRL